MGLTTRYCHECGLDQVFDQPHETPGGCPDAPDGDCLEWVCTGCGLALITVIPGSMAVADGLLARQVA